MPPEPPDSTATFVRGSSRTKPLEILVRVVGAQGTPPLFRLRSGTCVIGSAPPCDIVIADSTVSRMHAELNLVPEGVAVRDLGSRNGTYYLGQRVEKIVLAPGARIEVGAATLSIEPDTQALGEDLAFDRDEYRGAVGRSAAMRRLFAMLTRLEGSLVTVLLDGESGVGKEVIARALHEGSQVAAGPLVTVNCGAIPRELVASELFGHKKGAFTGAVEARTGAFDEADGGTLFLDEIGELPIDLQPALLRVLETGEVRAVGADRPHTVRVRVVAATNRDLAEEVNAGRFREDLFYRLAVVRLSIPPLRERIEDIEPLASRFAAAAGLAGLPGPIVEALKARSYPGNARELRNAVQAYAALGVLPQAARKPGATLDLALSELVDTSRPYADLKEDLTDRFTKLYIAALLARTGGNQSAAARLAGLDRTHLGRLVAKYGPFGGGKT
ncbi:MAG: sigma 54-dependent Fis family transcriptional regulator [Myxococcales bacterium]|nr:sigma 54-dependent Fis family transcriptional regulator [Myxococcales bacterium]